MAPAINMAMRQQIEQRLLLRAIPETAIADKLEIKQVQLITSTETEFGTAAAVALAKMPEMAYAMAVAQVDKEDAMQELVL